MLSCSLQGFSTAAAASYHHSAAAGQGIAESRTGVQAPPPQSLQQQQQHMLTEAYTPVTYQFGSSSSQYSEPRATPQVFHPFPGHLPEPGPPLMVGGRLPTGAVQLVQSAPTQQEMAAQVGPDAALAFRTGSNGPQVSRMLNVLCSVLLSGPLPSLTTIAKSVQVFGAPSGAFAQGRVSDPSQYPSLTWQSQLPLHCAGVQQHADAAPAGMVRSSQLGQFGSMFTAPPALQHQDMAFARPIDAFARPLVASTDPPAMPAMFGALQPADDIFAAAAGQDGGTGGPAQYRLGGYQLPTSQPDQTDGLLFRHH